tara:strand:+ start:55 stop:894 length:840 start_codon:yes stop_codon:yes gene_type:complete
MIIWLASYPKSGNTWLRSIIASLLYTNDGVFDFSLIKKIKQFPSRKTFKDFTENFNNINEISKFWIIAQEKINLTNEIKILKTHNLNCKIKDNFFTDKSNTLGTIYVVRDPRSLVSSISNFYQKDYEKSKNFLISKQILSARPKDLKDNDIATLIGSWSDHYNFWTKKNDNLLLVKYENLISDIETELNRIIGYLKKFMEIEINAKKIQNIIDTTSFNNLQKMEKEGKFDENMPGINNERIQFFNKGPSNNWKKQLDKKIQEDIERIFNKEMKDLGYLK